MQNSLKTSACVIAKAAGMKWINITSKHQGDATFDYKDCGGAPRDSVE
jgi:hypothetical protein